MSNKPNSRLAPDANRDKLTLSQIWNQWLDNLKAWRHYLSSDRARRKAKKPASTHTLRARLESARHILRNARQHHRSNPVGEEATAPVIARRSASSHHQFPESNSVIVQFALFAAGILPHVVENREGRKARWRSQRTKLANRFHLWGEKVRLHPAAFLSGALAIVCVTAALSFYTVGTSVSYNGYDLGTVGGIGVVDRTISLLEDVTRKTLGNMAYAVDESLLNESLQVVPRGSMVDREAFTKNLSRQLDEVTYAYTLYVDDQPIAATTYPGALEELLEQLKENYTSANTVESYFTEKVEIRQEYVSNEYVMNLGYIAELLNETKEGAVTYTVKAGDAPLSIADAYGITYDQLKAMNPGYNWKVLTVGDVLTISNAVPYLTVVNVEQQSYVQSIPYEVEYTDDSSMYQGDYKIVSAGSYGKADIVANVTLINGEETERSVVSSVTLLEPVTEQQLTGTKTRPSWFPTGSFRWPCNGIITSYFGYRNTGIRGASSYHAAIDIANGYGTPIYASDGGTVITAGWVSGLGYTVKIDHGNGYVTTYGHNSSLTVSVGAQVHKGQQIARMGSTGISSGNHCDFRICLNGTYVDPLKYLS